MTRTGRALVHNLTVDQAITDVFDIPVTVLSGDLFIDGQPAPMGEHEDGNLFLRDGLDVIRLGNTHDGSYEVRVIPGAFDVLYEYESGGEAVPTNSAAILSSTMVAGAEAIQDFDVGRSEVAGDFTVNGEPAPMSVYASGQVSTKVAGSEDQVIVGIANQQSYSAALVPGTYEIYYDALNDFPAIPLNQDTRLGCFTAP